MLTFLTALAVMRAIWQRPPVNLARYLWAVLLQIPTLWLVHYWYGDESAEYAAYYVLFTGFILYTIWRIAIDAMIGQRYRLRATAIMFVLALTLTRVASLDMHGQWAWISLSEGFLLLWAGLLTAFAGVHRPRRDLYFTLGFFWIAQGGYSLGWSVAWKDWADYNWLVPPLMAIGCFGYLARRLRLRPVEA